MRATSLEMLDRRPYERHEAILRECPGLDQHLMEWDIVLTLLKYFTIVWDGRRTRPIVHNDAR